MRSICIVLLVTLAFGCGKKEQETAAGSPSPAPVAADSSAVEEVNYRYEVIAAPENTFGYDIYKGDAMFIHQPHIPGMPGVKGFAREEQARKAADLMITKMKNGVMPPTLSEEEITDIMSH